MAHEPIDLAALREQRASRPPSRRERQIAAAMAHHPAGRAFKRPSAQVVSLADVKRVTRRP